MTRREISDSIKFYFHRPLALLWPWQSFTYYCHYYFVATIWYLKVCMITLEVYVSKTLLIYLHRKTLLGSSWPATPQVSLREEGSSADLH